MASPPGTLLSHLPGIFHGSEDLARLLRAFEQLMFRAPDGAHMAIEQRIDAMSEVLEPERVDDPFLDWLGQWVALSGELDMEPAKRRALMTNIVPMYEFRGTQKYLAQILEFFTPDAAEIDVVDRELPSLTVGRSAVGRDTWLGGGPAFWFRVDVRVPRDALSTEQEAAFAPRLRAVIDMAKPAHTHYQFDWRLAS